MSITLTYGGLNLNDGTTYALMPEADFGERTKTFDEYRSYDGVSVVQYNVSEASIIPMNIPLRIKSTSATGLRAAIDALNTKIDAGAQTMIYNDGSGNITYDCVHSPRVNYIRTQDSGTGFYTFITLALNRTP